GQMEPGERIFIGRGRAASSQPRHRALTDVVAASEFGKRSALGSKPAGLSLLRVSQFRRPTHVLAALLRPAASLGGASADEIE
ncbi:MAG: hypothetical protein ACREEZ_05340, partial [Stellaceae bacterium]